MLKCAKTNIVSKLALTVQGSITTVVSCYSSRNSLFNSWNDKENFGHKILARNGWIGLIFGVLHYIKLGIHFKWFFCAVYYQLPVQVGVLLAQQHVQLHVIFD